MPSCVVKLCKNNSKNNTKRTGITFHKFPVDPDLLERWIAIVRRSRGESSWKPGERSVICSAHFNETDLYTTKGGLKRLSKGTVPFNQLFLSSIQTEIPTNGMKKEEPNTSFAKENSTNPSSSDSHRLHLEKKLRKSKLLQFQQSRTIKTLRQKVRRLQKVNVRLKNIIRRQRGKGVENK